MKKKSLKKPPSLKNGDAVGWFQERMEFGPRALGGRSILGDLDLLQCKKFKFKGEIQRKL